MGARQWLGPQGAGGGGEGKRGTKGVIYDGTDYLTTQEFGNAIAAAKERRGNNIDIVHLVSCTMQMTEVAYQIKDDVNYLVGYENVGWRSTSHAPEQDYLERITGTTGAEELADFMADEYHELWQPFDWGYTVSVLNLGYERVLHYVDALSRFGTALIGAWAGHEDGIRSARADTQTFDYDGSHENEPTDSYVDIRDFALEIQRVAYTGPDPAWESLQEAARGLAAAIGDMVVEEHHQSGVSFPYVYNFDRGTYGLSIYFPVQRENLLDNYLNRGDGPANLAFESEVLRGHEYERRILKMTADGGEVRDLCEGSMPAWSPELQ